MRRIPSGVLRCLSVSLLALLALSPARAQDKGAAAATRPSTPQWLSFVIVDIKPEMVAEYEEFVKKETLPALQKGGLAWRAAWQTGVFGKQFRYVYVNPIPNFAQYDGDSLIQKALGKDGAQLYQTKQRRFATNVRITAAIMRPDLSDQRKMAGPPKLGVASSFSIAPGRTKEFESFIRDHFLPVIKRSKASGYWVSQTIFGGDGNEYNTLLLWDKYGDLDNGPPTVQVLGQEAADKLMLKLAPEIVLHTERVLVRYNPELSFGTPAPAEPKK
jgi:hypothetical protein